MGAVVVTGLRLDAPVILDGEIVALRGGRPDFGALQSRRHVRRPPARLVQDTPVQLYLFDLLHHGPNSLLGLPCTGRRDRLEELGLDADPVRTPPWYRDDAEIILATSQIWPGGWSASRWPPATIRAAAGTGSRSRSSGTPAIGSA